MTLECEFGRGSPIEVWSGPATSRALVRSTPLRANLSGRLVALAYVPDQDRVIIATDAGLFGVSLTTGNTDVEYVGVSAPSIRGLAYESSSGRLLILDATSPGVVEFEL